MHGLTTIAAIPRSGGAGMALRGETNTPQISTIPWAYMCLLWTEIEREREAWARIAQPTN